MVKTKIISINLFIFIFIFNFMVNFTNIPRNKMWHEILNFNIGLLIRNIKNRNLKYFEIIRKICFFWNVVISFYNEIHWDEKGEEWIFHIWNIDII